VLQGDACVVCTYPVADEGTFAKVSSSPTAPALGIRMEAEIETGLEGGGTLKGWGTENWQHGAFGCG
jgi:hypothetical protein